MSVVEIKALPSLANECILPADYLGTYVRLRPWSESPGTWSEGLVQNTTVFDFGKVDESIFHEQGEGCMASKGKGTHQV